jgi:thiosulfate/3-mercaptopyruvate sulfurtransferase
MTVRALAHLVGTGRVTVIDAREPEHYEGGHIPGAMNLHPAELETTEILPSGEEVPNVLVSAEEVADILGDAGVSSDLPICVYDEGGGYLAARLWWVFDYLGFEHASVLDGGLIRWEHAMEALDFTPTVLPPTTFVPHVRPERKVSFSEVITLIGASETVLCNALSFSSFLNETLPMSVNCPFGATYTEDNFPLMRTKHELATLLHKRGAGPQKRLICFCGIGYCASQVYFAARVAGYEHVALYDGSMTDWQRRGGELVPGEM